MYNFVHIIGNKIGEKYEKIQKIQQESIMGEMNEYFIFFDTEG